MHELAFWAKMVYQAWRQQAEMCREVRRMSDTHCCSLTEGSTPGQEQTLFTIDPVSHKSSLNRAKGSIGIKLRGRISHEFSGVDPHAPNMPNGSKYYI